MNRRSSTGMRASIALLVGSVVATAIAAAKGPPQGGTVNGNAEESFQLANNKVKHSEPLIRKVTGTCEDDVSVARHDVTIDGNNNSVVVSEFHVEGLDRILIKNLAVTDQGCMVFVFSSSVTLENVTAIGNEGGSGPS